MAPECAAPAQEQFDQIWKAYKGAGVTIVYCGYGDGRTGMAISAIQLFEGRALGELDFRANGVQCGGQIEALNALREGIHRKAQRLTQHPRYGTPTIRSTLKTISDRMRRVRAIEGR
ncbi:unnamed protein product [Tuber aestivum]|uniref:Tyrosine specific protein phosphatases domain-containing protein n=1 Tax=Tuber aestivum TaxID=59557 RepID=A0A292Q9F2_9PEZI|nr:unnamed protein product [Tuber aestivum]